LLFNPLMWGAASNGHTMSTEPNLVQSPLSLMENGAGEVYNLGS
jgi:hypothetical protein